MSSFLITDKGKISDFANKTIFYPADDFVEEIVNKDTCFICGANNTEKDFNNEHIIPKWLLKRLDIFDKEITLPNCEKRKYSGYKIPCCVDCNSELGIFYETPLSNLLKPKYEDLKESLNVNDAKLIFKWMSLIFLKTHLKDKEIRYEPDLRNESIQNSEMYDWLYMHHIHCIVRSFYTDASIEDDVFGSLIFISIKKENETDNFDFVDSHAGRVISIRVGDYAIIAVLDDSCICKEFYRNELEKIKGQKLSFLQIREVVANLVAINLNIKNRPHYSSGMDPNCKYKIFADIPKKIQLLEVKDRINSGKFLRYYVNNIKGLNFSEDDLKKIESNEMGFLWDKNGDFYDCTGY